MSDLHRLKHKTRGNSTPSEKPRVYFCAHHNDFPAFFTEISSDILRHQDCSVWYDDGTGDTTDEETRAFELSQMNLFVIPVTERLLHHPDCRAMLDFHNAVQKHIPVLPLLTERGLEKRFNEIFGDLQMLDPYSSNETAIGYEEKLSQYLSSVLIGDKLTEQIRAAFDAYIFLSYRKKDRKYAQELMRLIHKNEFCRDIAIWYDEFLSPGENFNDAIASALTKSNLFVMAVTPSLVDETNYVMTVEYPKAREEKKPVLPLELLPTDLKALKQTFEGIPETVNAYDGSLLSKALKNTFKSIALFEQNRSPEHLFFIGLAYLSGIEVEIDHDRALELISKAAEAGLDEAIIKCAQMYRNGEGVSRNPSIAVEWQRKLIEIRKKTYTEGKDEASLSAYLSALEELGALLHILCRFKEAEEIYQKILFVCEQAGGDPLSQSRLRPSVIALGALGTIQTETANVECINNTAFRLLHLCEKAEQETRDAEIRGVIALGYEKLGDFRRGGALRIAETYYRKSFELLNTALGSSATQECRGALVSVCRKLGEVLLLLCDRVQAAEYYRAAYSLAKALAEEHPSYSSRVSLIESSIRAGDAERACGNSELAERSYQTALSLSEKASEEIGTIAVMRLRSISETKLADIEKKRGNLIGAIHAYQRAVQIREDIVREVDSLESHESLGSVCLKLSGIVSSPEECRLWKERALQERARILQKCPGYSGILLHIAGS